MGFFHDEIESPERVTILVIILSESLLTSRIIAHSVKNSIELLSQKWGSSLFLLNHKMLSKLSKLSLIIKSLRSAALRTRSASQKKPPTRGGH